MNKEWATYFKENKRIFTFILIVITTGILIQYAYLEEQKACYKDATGRIIECSTNTSYLIEKYNLSTEHSVNYSNIKIVDKLE